MSSLLWIVLAMTPAEQQASLAALLPPEVEGVRPLGEGELFDRDSLFSLIDGGAEVYRELNVQAVLSQRYSSPAAGEVLVDVFDMGSPLDAFGAFHVDVREGASAGIGAESELQGGNLSFWKDRYFVSVVALRPLGRPVVRALGAAVARAISGTAGPPDLVGLLPRDGLIASQVHTFHGPLLLERLLPLSSSNPLGLDRRTFGVLARYRAGAESAFLLVRYPSESEAKRAEERFSEVAAVLSFGWSGVERRGALLRAALSMPDEATGRRLLRAVLKGDR